MDYNGMLVNLLDCELKVNRVLTLYPADSNRLLTSHSSKQYILDPMLTSTIKAYPVDETVDRSILTKTEPLDALVPEDYGLPTITCDNNTEAIYLKALGFYGRLNSIFALFTPQHNFPLINDPPDGDPAIWQQLIPRGTNQPISDIEVPTLYIASRKLIQQLQDSRYDAKLERFFVPVKIKASCEHITGFIPAPFLFPKKR